jgi:hypothetical protein
MAKPAWALPKPRFAVVLAALLLILILAPVLQQEVHPALSRMLDLLGFFVPVLAVSVAGDATRPRRIAIGLAILCALGSADSMLGLVQIPLAARIGILVVFLAYTTSRLLSGVARSRKVTADVIAGALAGYMMVGLTWATAYGFLETLWPGSIRGLAEGGASLDFPTLLYFSYITLLTIGYGDITPASPPARTMAVLEGLLGMAFTTIVLAVLVAAHLRHQDERGPDEG